MLSHPTKLRLGLTIGKRFDRYLVRCLKIAQALPQWGYLVNDDPGECNPKTEAKQPVDLLAYCAIGWQVKRQAVAALRGIEKKPITDCEQGLSKFVQSQRAPAVMPAKPSDGGCDGKTQ